MPAELRFRAMGTDAMIIVVGGPRALVAQGRRRVEELERRWSRFLPSSEITRLNGQTHGRPTIVSADTYRLVDTAVVAWHRTAGRFDPTLLAAMNANGYDRSFETIETNCSPTDSPQPAPGCAGIVLDPELRAITLPPGVRIDPGGIGKGLAADLVAAELVAAGADGALVDLGGDMRVVGHGTHDGAWIIDIEDPVDPHQSLLHIALTDAAIATSSILRRRWTTTCGERHHLLDPTTGRPLTTPLIAATVIAAHGWWAEALAKAILVAGDLTPVTRAGALALDANGVRHATPDLEVLAA